MGKSTVVIVAMGALSLMACTNKNQSLQKKIDSTKFFTEICIGGHSYWFQEKSTKGYIANKLDSRGRPVPCIGSIDDE